MLEITSPKCQSFATSATDKKTIIVFDWDDTLFPTSWLTKEGCLVFEEGMPVIKLTDDVQCKLEKFEVLLCDFLTRFLNTNAIRTL